MVADVVTMGGCRPKRGGGCCGGYNVWLVAEMVTMCHWLLRGLQCVVGC